METRVLHRTGYLVLSLCLQLCLTAQHSADRPACSTGGAAFGIDLLGNSLLVKDPNGYIGSLRLAPATKLLRLSVRGMSGGEKTSEIKLGEIQSGDLVCAVTGEDNAIAQLSVVSRADIEQAQREYVARWQKDSVFGRVMSLDAAGQKMIVAPTIASETPGLAAVSVTGATQLRTFPKGATQISEARTISLNDVQTGDTVYVHGQRIAGNPSLQAGVIISGGFRGIIGSFLDAHPMQGTVKLHEYGSGKELTLQIGSAALYRTSSQLNSPYRIFGPEGPTLAQINIGDLQAGDIVLIVGASDEGSSEGTGVMLITRFGSFAAVPGANNQVSWFLK